jgi:hypothetical protein
MTGTLAAGAFSREARMILRLIDKPDTRLVEAGSGEWGIESGKAAAAAGRRSRTPWCVNSSGAAG